MFVSRASDSYGTFKLFVFCNISIILPVTTGAMSRSVLDRDLPVGKKPKQKHVCKEFLERSVLIHFQTKANISLQGFFLVYRLNNRIILRPMAIMQQAPPLRTKRKSYFYDINKCS